MNLFTDFIAWDTIPKTYRESIEITRSLGIEYIWIDSLCIIQDDPEDWLREAEKMKTVYGNSYLNISATHAVDSHGGLFVSSNLGAEYFAHKIPQDPDIYIRSQPHQTHWPFGSNYNNMPHSPLLQRGWVFQERMLSPRMVHFDADELKWECQVAGDCQCGGMVVISNFKRDYYRSLRHEEPPMPYQWMRISERYSSLKFTYDKDRLIALAGIVQQGVQSGKGEKYLAGLWERNLSVLLCWKIIDTHRRPDTYLAPSWSWLSVFGTVEYSRRLDFHSTNPDIDVKITEVVCTSTKGSIATASTSPVVGFLRLKGRGLRMRAELADFGTQSTPPVYCLQKHCSDSRKPKILVQADYSMTREDASAITEVFLVFWGIMMPDQVTFLVLRSASIDSHKFERLGITWFLKGDKAKDLEQILADCEMEDNIIII